MRVQEFFDLAWIDILAPPNDHILNATHDIEVALGIHHTLITGMHPSRLINRLHRGNPVIPVAQHDAVAACAYFTRFANRHDPSRTRIDHFYLHMWMCLADRPNLLLKRGIDMCLRRDRTGLGHAKADGDLLHVHQGFHLLHHLDWAGSPTHDAGTQRTQVVFGEVGMIQQSDKHGWNAHQDRTLLLMYGLQHRQWLKYLGRVDHRCTMGDAA